MADREDTAKQERPTREEEQFFKQLDRLPEAQYQAFATSFLTSPNSALTLSGIRNLPENAEELVKEYIDDNLRNERQHEKAANSFMRDVTNLGKTLEACAVQNSKVDPDVCAAARDVLGELNAAASPDVAPGLKIPGGR